MNLSLHTNIKDLLQRWITRYYDLLPDNPTVRSTHETHLKYIEQINIEYLKDLTKHYRRELIEPEERYKEFFKEQIDFLTGVYTKEKENEKLKGLRESLKAIPNKHYTPH